MSAGPLQTGEPVRRRGARVFLVDRMLRLLLFRGRDPGDLGRGTWWFTPGGGVEVGETVRAAAARELAEETGLVLKPSALIGPVWERTSQFSFSGRRYRQEDQFFLARVDHWHVDTSGFTALEREAVDLPRWWPLDELVATSDTVYPTGLAARVQELCDAQGAEPAGAVE